MLSLTVLSHRTVSQVRHSGAETGGIGFHWDQDEDLMDSEGLSLCPQISTITYLTDVGAPTLILDARAPLQCEDTKQLYSMQFDKAHLSYPRCVI